MPSHSERVRRNYRCADCDGSGRVGDYDGGEYACVECDGTGVVLVPKPKPAPRALEPHEQVLRDLVASESMKRLMNDLAVIQRINQPIEIGEGITVRMGPRWRAPHANTAEQLARRADFHAGE